MSAIEEAELVEIEQRAGLALAIAPTPWTSLLETRHAIGGESFIRLGDDPYLDLEMYVSLHIGSQQITSPSIDLDAVVDFIAHASDDIPRLIAEIRRLRRSQSSHPTPTTALRETDLQRQSPDDG